MRRALSVKLQAAARASAQCRDHPFPDPVHQAVADQLAELVARAERVAVEELLGRGTVVGAIRSKTRIRTDAMRYLRVIAKVGVRADHDLPGIALRLKAPHRNAPIQAFLATAWGIHQEASANLPLLRQSGLGPDMLARLAEALAKFDADTGAVSAGKATHIGAAAELRDLVHRIGEVLAVLDALNLIRFQDDPGLMAAWRRARHAATPHPSSPDAPDPPGEPEHPAADAS